MDYFLDVEVKTMKNGFLLLSQSKYVRDLLPVLLMTDGGSMAESQNPVIPTALRRRYNDYGRKIHNFSQYLPLWRVQKLPYISAIAAIAPLFDNTAFFTKKACMKQKT